MRWLSLCLLLLWPAALAAQSESDRDRGFIQGLLEDALSGEGFTVRLDGFAGALSSRATVDEISISDPQGVWFSARDVALVWNRSALTRGRVEIEEISIGRIDLPRLPQTPETPPSPEAGSPFALPELPVSLVLEALRVDEANIGAPVLGGEAATLALNGSAALAGGEGEAALTIERLDRGGQIAFEGSYSNSTRVLGLDLSVSEPEGGLAVGLLGVPGEPSAQLQISGEGPIDDFEASVQLATDGSERLGGTVVLRADGESETRRYRVDLSGDLAPVVAPQYRDFLGRDIGLVAEVVQEASGAIELSELDLNAQALSLTGFARIAPDGWPEVLDLSGNITPPQGDSVVLPIGEPRTSIAAAQLTGRFDADSGSGWQLTARVQGVERDGGGRLDRLAFTGGGEIARDTGRVSGLLDLTVEGIALADAALDAAIGERLTGQLGFDWQNGAPLRLRELDLAGADYGLTGAITVSDVGTLNPIISPDLTVLAEDLGRFAPLAGIALQGRAELAVSGSVEPVTGALDLAFDGTTRDLGTGIAQLDPVLAGPGTLRLALQRDETGLRAEGLRIATGAAQIEGDATLAQEGSRADLTLAVPDASIVLPGVSGTAQAQVTARQEGEAFAVDLVATLPDTARITYTGRITPQGPQGAEIEGQLSAQVSRLTPFSDLAGRPLRGSADVVLTGAGALGPQSFDATLQAVTRDVALGLPAIDPLLEGETTLSLDAARDRDGVFSLTRLRLGGLAEATFDGTIQGTNLDTLTAEGRLTALVPRLAPFSQIAGRRLSGGAEIAVEGQGAYGPRSFDVTARGSTAGAQFGVPAVDPLLTGQTSFELAAARAEDGTFTLTRARLDGPAQAQFDGLLTGRDVQSLEADGTLNASVPSLSVFSGLAGRRLAGSLTVEARAQGRLLDGPLDIEASARGQGLSASIPAVDPLLSGTTNLVLDATRDAQGTYTVDRLSVDGPAQARFSGTIAGDGRERLDIDGSISGAVPRLSALNGLSGQTLSGSVRFEGQASGDALNGPFGVTATATAQDVGLNNPSLDPFLRGTTRADFDATRTPGGAFVINRLTVDGASITGSASGRIGTGEANLRADISIAGFQRLVPDLPGTVRVSGTASRSGGPWTLDLNGSGPGGIGADVSGTAAQDFSRVNLALSGSAPLSLANARLAPQVVTGTLGFNLRVNGPPALSSVSGSVTAQDARFAAPAFNVAVENIAGGVQLNSGNATIDLTGRLTPEGRLSISGPVRLQPPFNAEIVVQLADALLREAGLFETRADARISVTGPLTGGARIDGRVDLGQVELRVPSFGPSYAALDGLRHVNPPADVRRTLELAGLNSGGPSGGGGGGGADAALPGFPVDLRVNAPNRIFVRGRGLDAELGGSLRLTGTTTDIEPVGQFDLIRGRLDLLGRRLELTEGGVFLRGSFDPIITFAARTVVEDTEITIRIEGPASEPELTVTSVPELPQDEALAFFLFGQGVQNLSPLQAVQLAAAIRTLSGQGGLGITNNIRDSLGVDDLDIGTDADGNAEARVGKYISENIYTDVTVNSEGQSEINLNLTVTDEITVRGRVGSDGDSGVGVFFERDY